MKLIDKIKSLFKKNQKKVLGLALGSGGAKGMALIGALKVFEENDIKFDMVSGTSIGSIVGGMYAAGFDTSEMFGFMREYDVMNPKTLILMKLKGMTVESLLDNMLGGMVIEDLKLPYSAIACDINSGEEVIMDSGNLAKAMACSSAIPPVFKPVARDNRKLIDGALINSVPGDVLKARGADCIIAVSLTEDPMNTKSKEVIDKLYRGNGVQLCNRYEKGISCADYVIAPDLHQFSAASLSGLKEMYAEGYRAASVAMPEIKKILKAKKFIK